MFGSIAAVEVAADRDMVGVACNFAYMIDVIDDKRKQEGAISVWERDMKYFSTRLEDWQANPNVNRFIREPGHIQYASTLGMGVYDLDRITHTELTV